MRAALIRIHIVSAEYRQGREIKAESSGSGVIISSDGYAVTNHHVTQDAERITCTLADRREVEAKLVGADPLADIAVIKLDSPDGKAFPTASFGDSSKLKVGERVFALGCPLALSQSITLGIVSNTEMIMPADFTDDEFRLEGEDVGSIVRWIGHDALIRPGNSGGPLVNDDGLIVGINEISVGLAGAIPSNLASDVVRQLIANGKVTRSWLGIEVQPLLRSSGIDKGILVSGVIDGSPAKKAGFMPGDILTSLDGREVSARFREETPLFNQYVATIPVGKTVEAKILRDGHGQTLNVTTEARARAIEKESEVRSWGICGTNITFILRKEMQLDSQDGVIVTSVLPSGPAGAAKPALREGDVIVRVGAEKVKDITALRDTTRKLTDGKTESVGVLVDLDRRQKHLATVIKVGKSDFSEPSIEIAKAWLGVDTQVLTRDLAEGLGVPGRTGVRVTQVYPDTSAAKAGFKVADLIVKLDGEDIPCDQIGDEEVFPSLIRQYEIGSEVKLGIIRGDKPMTISVGLEAASKPARDYPKYENEHFEFTARDIVFSDRADQDVPSGLTGVYVESVAEGGWASLGLMRAGDCIMEVAGTPVANVEGLKKILADLAEKKPKTVVFKVMRGVHTMFLEVQPSWSDSGA